MLRQYDKCCSSVPRGSIQLFLHQSVWWFFLFFFFFFFFQIHNQYFSSLPGDDFASLNVLLFSSWTCQETNSRSWTSSLLTLTPVLESLHYIRHVADKQLTQPFTSEAETRCSQVWQCEGVTLSHLPTCDDLILLPLTKACNVYQCADENSPRQTVFIPVWVTFHSASLFLQKTTRHV